jgi:hypothetical protein
MPPKSKNKKFLAKQKELDAVKAAAAPIEEGPLEVGCAGFFWKLII